MKNISLESIRIHNFKGISDLMIEPNGKSIDIFGDNDAGKTTIYDAFLWCLFNKDSKERTKIQWRPLDENSEPIRGKQTSVTVVLAINGQAKEFEKVRGDKEVIKRNSEHKSYEMFTKYLVDGLETTTKKAFDDEVEKVLDQDTFKNLTSVTYFCEQLVADERRQKLFEYFGSKTDEEIINETPSIHQLKEIIGNDDIKTARDRVLQDQKRINETLKNIPVKIEGIQAALPDIENINKEQLLTTRNELTSKKNDIENQLVTIRNGGNISELIASLNTKQEELTAAKLKYDNAQNARINGIEQGKSKLFADFNKAQKTYADEESSLNVTERLVSIKDNELIALNKKHEELYDKYDEVEAEEFTGGLVYTKLSFNENLLVCQHCNRPYDVKDQDEMKRHHEEEEQKRAEEIELTNKEIKAQFEADKQIKLSEIREKGIQNNKDREALKKEIGELKEQLLIKTEAYNIAKKHLEDVKENLADVEQQISSLKLEKIPFEATEKYSTITKEIKKLQEYITQSNEAILEQTSAKTSEITEIDKEIAMIDEKLALLKEYERQLSIIEDFNEQERQLSHKKGEVLQKLVLFEEFFITKQNMLQEIINSHFSVVKWKLFDFFEDGGLNEAVCEPMIDGVPFSSLNNGSRMQAGLDVSNTLMKQEGYIVPIFIDNAEGLTNHNRDSVQVDTQVIAMYVNEDDKTLRIKNHKTEGK
ncbi:AAA family ATPase [Enterococcus faecalis]|uniref:AAA family ATPase n=1 Tax=Enterococcus faecalis TaxID=1351 RepID=UPI0019FEDD9D|nr:AAA family ATPase [Enterococcus faecalis]EKA3075673.1 AAA family ATPase [Enterococcus faecalis]